ncbi:MAG: DUF2273 domain-containing protein [Firmicutes bacterium]|nr:DUF2273 domain-containing protein [Bacillota bacterium]
MDFQALKMLFVELWDKHRGKMIGIISGLLLGILVLTLGFWRAIFICLCIFIGYLVGKMVDEKVVDFREVVQRIIKNR